MAKLWNFFSYMGTDPFSKTGANRFIILSNRFAVVLLLLSVLLCIYSFVTGGSTTGAISLSFSGVFALILFLNSKGYYNAGRVFFCLFLPYLVLGITIAAKLLSHEVGISSFYNGRMLLMILPAFPLILFSFKELKILVISLTGSLLPLLFFDFFHELAGAGFHQVKLTTAHYSYINVISYISCLIILIITIIFKKNSLDAEKLLEDKNLILARQNYELQELYQETEAQNEKIQAQKEELNQNQEVLEEANKLIAIQKDALLDQNKDLQAELILKNANLQEANQKLSNHVNELEQFGYTLSHNLRGPVASLLGLTYLCSKIETDKKTYEFIEHISVSAQKVDQIIRDLGKIIDIRSDAYLIREWVRPEEEFCKVKAELQEQITASNAYIDCEFEVNEIFSVKEFVHNILFHLISNSLRFRSSSRPLRIFIRTYYSNRHAMLEVKDNGEGFDLKRYRNDVFRMYKRFNESQTGRGLGLYLVKLQAELLGGGAVISSEPGSGTSLTIDLGEVNFFDDVTE